MNYIVVLTDDARADIRGLAPGPKAEVNKVLNRLRSGTDPRFDLRLHGQKNRWRALAGRHWRVIFSMGPGRRIEVRRVTRRPDAYRGLDHPGYQELQEPRGRYNVEEVSVPAAAAD